MQRNAVQCPLEDGRGARCRWQVRVVDGRYVLSMAGTCCRWQVRVVDGGYELLIGDAGLVVGWCGSGCWVVAWVVVRRWLALGMVVVGVVHCDCRARCGCRGCGSSCRLLFQVFSRYLSF